MRLSISALLGCCAAAFAACASTDPRSVPAQVATAVFQYQLDEQAPAEAKRVFLSLIDPLRNRSVSREVARAIRTDKVFVSEWSEGSEPDLVLSVESRAERVYPDSLVVLGLVDLPSLAESHAYRYLVLMREGAWLVESSEEVSVETDCYGNYWVSCSSEEAPN